LFFNPSILFIVFLSFFKDGINEMSLRIFQQ
jgi:hypothetical protein